MEKMNLRPRNDGVIVRLLKKQEERVGTLHLPTTNNEYCEALILAVGPGEIAAAGARVSTFDLTAGQRVLVKYQTAVRSPDGMIRGFRPEGLRLDRSDDVYFFPELNVLAIFDESESS